MSTIPQNPELLKHLMGVLEAHQAVFKQQRIYRRVLALVLAEIMVFGRHTVTQLLVALGLNEQDWSSWYRLFKQRFQAEPAARVLLAESLKHVGADEVYVVAGDGTQTPRSSGRMEGVGWLRNMRSPAFKIGIHRAQRWFNGSWLMPAQNGYSRAMPLRWLPAFTPKSKRQAHEPATEWQAAVAFLTWLRMQLSALGRGSQRLLMVADGSYDTLALWKHLPAEVILLARSAKHRVLYHLPAATTGRGRPRKYGDRAATPQQLWRSHQGWRKIKLLIRGHTRRLQYRVEGPFVRQGAADTPLFLLIVRGQTYQRHSRRKHRPPVPYLVNAVFKQGVWTLPLPAATLIFWAWQRWEVEVCHRELKSNFGLGHKQCWHPISAVASVQWSAWVYAVLLLAGYRTWGVCGAPSVPTRWWRGAGRWSLNTLWRAYRAALWGPHDFRPLWLASPDDWSKKDTLLQGLRNAVYGATRS